MNRTPAYLPAFARSLAVALLLLVGCALPTSAADAAGTRKFDLPAGAAPTTLKQFSQQSGVELLYSVDQVERIQTRAVRGTLSPADALAVMLEGTGLRVSRGSTTGALAIVPSQSGEATAPPKSEAARVDTPPGSRAAGKPASLLDEPLTLSPYTVSTNRDRSYTAGQSLTAMGFAVDVFKTPLNISVVTDEFMRDLGMVEIGEITPYVSNLSSSPGNNTGDGATFRVRGVQTLWNTRNGVRRYSLWSTDNIARVETIKGPAAVFFGQQRPGGVINIVTKRPSFTESSELSLRTDNFGDRYAAIEAQGPLPVFGKNTVAYRVRGSWRDADSWRDWDWRKQTFWYGGVLVQPVKRLTIYAEVERTRGEWVGGSVVPQGYRRYHGYRNVDGTPVAGAEGEYMNPPAALRSWAIATQVQPPNSTQSVGWKPAGSPDLPYTRSGGPSGPVGSGLTSFAVTPANVVQILQERWRRNGINGWRVDNAAALAAGYAVTPVPTYSYQAANGAVTTVPIGELNDPMPDFSPLGRRFTNMSRYGSFNQEIISGSADIQLQITDWLNARGLYVQDNTDRWNNVGYADQPIGDGTIFPGNFPSQNRNDTHLARGEFLAQFLKRGYRDRWINQQNLVAGAETFKDYFRQRGTNAQINSQFLDYGRNYIGAQGQPAPGLPGGIPVPTLGNQTDRGWNPFRDAPWDVNKFYVTGHYDRPGAAAEFARQRSTRVSQYANYQGNFFKNRLAVLAGVRRETFEQWTANLPNLDNYTTRNSKIGPTTVPTWGANFEFLEGVTLFANLSRSYEPTFGGNRVVAANSAFQNLLTAAELNEPRPPTKGRGIDVGVKSQWLDGKVSGGVSIFEVITDLVYYTDLVATSADPRNADGVTRITTRGIGGTATYKGVDADVVLNLLPGYSAMIAASYLPTAKVTEVPLIGDRTRLGRRVANAPKYKFSTWNRYVFREGVFKGLSVGLGLRYQCEVQKSDVPNEALAKSPGYLVWDAMAGYSLKFLGRPTTASLNVSNLFDREYYSSFAVPGEPVRVSLSLNTRF